jgi:hypothetical protein
MTEAEIAQIEAEVIEVMEGVFDGFRQLDPQMIMAHFHPTATSWVWASVPRGHGRVLELTENWVEGKESWEGSWTETTVKVFSQDAALFQGVYEATITYPDGRIVYFPNNASWTLLLERTDDGWLGTIGDNGGGTGLRMDRVYGVYDIISFFGEDWTTPGGPSGTYELMADGNSVLTITVPGEAQEVSEVEYTIGDRMVDGCFTWGSIDADGDEWTGTICDGVFTADGPDGTAILHRRQ